MKRWVAAACCAFSLFAAGSFADEVKSLVRVKNLTSKQITSLVNQGYDVAREGKGFAEIVLEKSKINDFVYKGHPVKIIIDDLDAYIKKVQAAQTKSDKYFTYESASAQMKKWAEEYSHICRVESIGKSCEGLDIWALKLSDNPEKDEAEPAALIMGLHHSREWPTVEVAMATMKKLIEGYESDAELKKLVDSREVWFVPIVNPDGLKYSQEKSRYWRKNRRNNGNGSYGVDPNRNYGYQWGNVGASSSPSSDTYHGPHAFSEPETCAIRDLAKREKFQASISGHTYSELILYPFSYGYNIPNPDQKVFVKMAGDMAKFNGYDPKVSADLYPAMGDTDDFMYGELKSLSFTFELCTTFIPAATEIDKFNSINVPAYLYLIDKAGTYGLVTPSGDEELINGLDFESGAAAIKDIVSLFNGEDHISVRNEVLARIEKISQRVADLVNQQLKEGSTEYWQILQAMPEASLAISFVRNRVLFNNAHGESYRSDIIEAVKNR
ncbi:MAG: M14 family metallopeptidase [Candidatus Rifleibacteriota bacterium]